MTIRGMEGGYFFQHKDGSPLTKYQFWKLTDMALEKVGVKNTRFGTHSFRIGAASTAVAMGYTAEQIKQLGRWSSNCYRRYVRQLPNVQAVFVLSFRWSVNGGAKEHHDFGTQLHLLGSTLCCIFTVGKRFEAGCPGIHLLEGHVWHAMVAILKDDHFWKHTSRHLGGSFQGQ